jgi:hypothetical protein
MIIVSSSNHQIESSELVKLANFDDDQVKKLVISNLGNFDSDVIKRFFNYQNSSRAEAYNASRLAFLLHRRLLYHL